MTSFVEMQQELIKATELDIQDLCDLIEVRDPSVWCQSGLLDSACERVKSLDTKLYLLQVAVSSAELWDVENEIRGDM